MNRLDFVACDANRPHGFVRCMVHLCRHMPVNIIAPSTALTRRTAKAMDQAMRKGGLPRLNPGSFTGRHRLGADEVVRVKAQEYMTILHHLDAGDPAWIIEGHTQVSLFKVFDQRDDDIAQGIEAVAMDM